jgi:hypothetical protein
VFGVGVVLLGVTTNPSRKSAAHSRWLFGSGTIGRENGNPAPQLWLTSTSTALTFGVDYRMNSIVIWCSAACRSWHRQKHQPDGGVGSLKIERLEPLGYASWYRRTTGT